MQLNDEIIKAITNAMPADANINVVNGIGSLRVGVSWKLNKDPERPNKMSKTISIVVTDEAAQDFSNASSNNHQEVNDRVNAFLSQKLQKFDPNHDVPKYEAPPVEEWLITTNILNG